MIEIDVAIIGGTGIGSRLLELPGVGARLDTPAGTVDLHLVEREGAKVAVLSRHAAGHKVPPHRVPYVAMARAMAMTQVKGVLATAAVGSLRSDWTPGTLAIAHDFVDLSARNVTLFDSEIGHTDFSQPFSPMLRSALLETSKEKGLDVKDSGVYLNLNGPRYETPAEVRLFGSWGCDVVGMTAGTEAIVMREAKVPYALVSVVTNLGTGLSSTELNHEEVGDMMQLRGGDVVDLLLATADRIASDAQR